MIEVGGKIYQINFEALDKLITSDKSLDAQDVVETKVIKQLDESGNITSSSIISKTYPKGKEIDGARYDCVGIMIQVIMNTDAEIDDTLGIDRGLQAMPLNWKIAFNTLKKYNILEVINEE